MINISYFSKHIFWNYNKNAKLPEKIVARQVFLYGEIKDMIAVTRLISKEKLERVINDIKKNVKNEKRANFVEKIIMEKIND